MIFRRIVGRYTVKIVPRSLLPNVIETLSPLAFFIVISLMV